MIGTLTFFGGLHTAEVQAQFTTFTPTRTRTSTQTPTRTPTSLPTSACLLGDANGNGAVSLSEAQKVVDNLLGASNSAPLCVPPRYIDNGDGTVTDNETGLMWEQKTNDSTVHDKDFKYVWASSGALPTGTAFSVFLAAGIDGGVTGVGDCKSADGTTQIGGFAGHCDWRIPTVRELRTIHDATRGVCGGGSGACLDPIFGPAVSGGFWTATTDAADSSRAWNVGFFSSIVSSELKAGSFSVRAVRGAGHVGRFIESGDGTTTDSRTGLTWEKMSSSYDPATAIHYPENTYSWNSAIDGFLAIDDLNGGVTGVGNCVSSDGVAESGGFAGHCDWRLPTVAELQTILLNPFPCPSSPCVNATFLGPAHGYYWSATTVTDNALFAWIVNFDDGFVSLDFKETPVPVPGGYYHRRAVRGGL